MKIKFREYEILQGEKKDGELWKAYVVHGTKLEDGEVWKSTNVFDNKHNASVIQQIKALEVGDKINVEHVKNGRFWNVSGITPCADEPDPTKSSSGGGMKRSGGRKSGNNGGGDTMSKEEWAEKNKVDRLSIAKSVALKAAIEAGNTTPAKAIKFADAIIPWLIDVEPQVSEPANDEDPLDPPS
jgi:hypothetical protein